MKRRSSWSILSSKPFHETLGGRDVYNDQQLDRQDLPEMQSMTLRLVLAVIASVFVGFLFYTFWAVIASTTARLDLSSGSDASGPPVVSESSQNTAASSDGSSGSAPDYAGDVTQGAAGGGSGSGGTGTGEASWDNVIANLTGEPSGSSGDAVQGSDSQNAYADNASSEGSVWDGVVENMTGENSGSNGQSGSYPDDPYASLDSGQLSPEPAGFPQVSETQNITADEPSGQTAFAGFHWYPYSIDQVFFTLLVTFGTFGLLYEVLRRNLKAQNMLADTTDINQYKNDQHIMLPEEIHRKFNWFPDSGAHADVTVNCLISHSMLNNKGIEPVEVTSRYPDDLTDPETGDVIIHKGAPVIDAEGNTVTEMKPMFDRKFADALFDSVDVHSKSRIFYDPTRIPYNPEGKRGKKKYASVADFINNEWTFPEYEVQRPGGAYLVDTDPVNVLVLAITRAGKGQTMIEPTIDAWTREVKQGNIVVNDPKGGVRRSVVKSYGFAAKCAA